MRYFKLLCLLCVGTLHGQITYPIYKDGRSKEEIENPNPTCLQSDVAKFIAENTDSEFVNKTMNVGDSIQFKINFVIGKNGNVVPSTIKVDTQYDFFNQYMIGVVSRLPQFVPAKRKELAFDYPFAATPQFTVISPGKMISLYDCDAFKIKRERLFSDGHPALNAFYPGCETLATLAEKRKCTQNKILQLISDEFSPIKPRHIQNGNTTVVVRFSISEQGKVGDIQVLQHPGYGTAEAAMRAIKKLPDMIPNIDEEGNPMKTIITIPISIYDI